MAKRIRKNTKSVPKSLSKLNILILYAIFAILSLVVTIWLTWPLLPSFTTALISQKDFTDGPFFVWNLWWVKKALLNFTNPFYSDFVYFPSRSNLALHTLTFTSGLIYLPLSPFFRPLTSLNIIQFFSFISSALGMILLFSYLAKPRTLLEHCSGFVSAVVFAFSPYVFSHLMAGHYNLSMIWPIPFLVYFLLRLLKEQHYKFAIGVGIIAAALAYLDLQLIFFSAAICLPIIVAYMNFKWKIFWQKSNLINIALAMVVFIVLFGLPYGYLMKDFWGAKDSFLTYNNGDVKILFGPNPLNPIFHFANYRLLSSLIGSYRENTISLGFISLLTSTVGFLLFPKKFWKYKILLIVILILGLTLTLGPNLQYNNYIYENIKLPYYYLQGLPFFNLGLVPSRFVLIAYFALGLLGSLSIFSVVKFFEDKNLFFPAICILLIVPGFILLEGYSGKMPIDPLYDIKQITEISRDKEDFSVLPYNAGQRDAYMQVLYNKKVVTGFLGRRIHDYYMNKYSAVYPINKFARGLANELNMSDTSASIKPVFDQYKIRYIIVEKNFKAEDELQTVKGYLSNLNIPIFFESDQVMVFKII